MRGYRNGYEGKRVYTAEWTIVVEVPQIRESLEPFESLWLRAIGKRSKRLLELVPMLYVKEDESARHRGGAGGSLGCGMDRTQRDQ